MSLPRREFLGLIPVSALSLSLTAGRGVQAHDAARAAGPVLVSPPVVQHPTDRGFTVHVAVSTLATGWVEWGRSADRLDQKAVAATHGLIQASDQALSIRVRLDQDEPSGSSLFYRVVAQPLAYTNAYQLTRGEPVASPVHELRLPSARDERITIAIVNDTHENLPTIVALHDRLAQVAPQVLVWNGDTCNDFDAKDQPLQIVLNPAQDVARGWAANRPLLFVPGNHDVRGARARELALGLSGWPGQPDLPYNFALRLGPIALVGLDTGEDKPDAHPVFAGTAAYEPYRHLQAEWLKTVVTRDDIASAPFRFAVCHIALRGLPGHNDGTRLDGYAYYSGMGARLRLPTLRDASFTAVISGHMHEHRIDDPTDTEPITQVVGGGPQPERATLTILRADANQAELRVEDLQGKTLHRREWKAAR